MVLRIFNLLLFTLCASISFGQIESYDSEQLLTEARQFYESGDYEQSITYFSKIDELDPNYLDAITENSFSYLYAEKAEEGLIILEKVYNEGRFIESPGLYVAYGSLLNNLEKYDEAEQIYLECEKFFPNYPGLLFNMGLMYFTREKTEKSIEYLKKAITINPNSARSHYILGLIALGDGQIAEGCLALLGYLANTPEDTYAKNAILAINVKMAQNYLDTENIELSAKGDDFEELTTILRSQIALNKNYKLNCSIDDIFPRHVQAIMEYASQHEVKDGFFENTYIPILADVFNSNQSEPFIYYMLLGSEELQKKLEKEKKKIEVFYESYYLPKFWNLYASRNLEHFGEMKDVVVYLNDGLPYQIGPIKDGMKNGKFKYVDEYGRMTIEGFYKDNEADGLAKFYNGEGDFVGESNYLKDDFHGNHKVFYTNGNIAAEGIYNEGKLEGEYSGYYINGGLSCKNNMKNGEYHGAIECQYENGNPQYSITYKEGVLDGLRTTYREDGSKSYVENYKNGELDGVEITYDIENNIISEISYTNGVPNASYEVLNRNGQVSLKAEIEDKNKVETYFDQGLMSARYTYKNMDLIKSEFFDNGIKYIEEEFDGDKLKSVKQFTAKDKKGKKLNLKNYTIFDIDGFKLGDRSFKKGLATGISINYYANGKASSKTTYVEGNITGLVETFDKYGNPETKYHAENNYIVGEFLNYKNGHVSSKYSYKEGKLNGPFWGYYTNGNISSKGFYVGDYLQGEMTYYKKDGSLSSVENYTDNVLTSLTKYYKNGEVEKFDFTNKTGEFNIGANGGHDIQEFSVVNGVYEGEYKFKDFNGTINFEGNYLNNLRHGEQKYYCPTGKVIHLASQKFGKYNGEARYFDHLGALRVISNFQNDIEEGIEIRKYHNGPTFSVESNHNGLVNGKKTYFSLKGDTIMNLEYKNDFIISYQVIKNGVLSKNTKVGNSKINVEGTYSNGKPAISIIINKKLFDEQFIIYQENGNPLNSFTYEDFQLSGPRKEYYENGQVYKTVEYKNGDRDGKIEYFDQDGNQLIKGNYVEGLLHGTYEIYEAGKLKTTKTYEENELVDIK